MKKILLGLFLVFGLFFSLNSSVASATGFDDVDWTVPMTSTTQAKLRIGVANFSKVWAYKATMTNGEVSALSLVCQYASSATGVNPLVKDCATFISNDNTNLILVAFSNTPNAGVIADLLPGNGGVFALSEDVQYPRIVSASVLAPGASPTIAQLIPEVNYGFPVLPQNPIAQNGDSGWNYLPFSSDSAWMGVGLPVPAEPGHYIIKLIKNAGAGQSSSGPTLDFKANGQTTVTLTSAPSTTNPVNLTWTATGVSTCAASTTATPVAPAVWTGTKTPSGSFALTNLAPSTNYQFKLDCSDSGGNHVIKSVTVKTAPSASTVTLTSSDADNSVLSNETFTLSWTSTGTPAGDSCSRSSTPAVAAWTAATVADNGGPIAIGPLGIGSYVFKVECNNPAGVLPLKAMATVTVTVTAPVASVVFANPSVTVQANGTATLNWTPTNAGSCNMASTSTPAGPLGTTTGNSWSGVFPTVGTFNYKVTCQTTGGALPVSPEATATVTVTAAPVASVDLAVSSSSVLVGSASPTLTWNLANVGTCTSSSTPAGWSVPGTINGTSTGTFSVPTTVVANYSFTITCTPMTGATAGILTDTVAVAVTTGTPAPVATVTFTAPIPTSVQAGGSITLNWTSNNTVANSCNRTGGFGTWGATAGPTSGGSGNLLAPAFSPTGNNSYTFTITCNSIAGATTPTATASVTVEVFVLPGTVIAVNIIATPDTVQVGQESTLKWTSSGIVGICSKTTSSDPSGLIFPGTWGNVSGNSSGLLGWPTGSFTTPGKYKYTITCTKPDGNTISAFTEVIVTTAPVASVVFNPTTLPTTTVQLANGTATATLNWTPTNANNCTIAATGTPTGPAGTTTGNSWTGTFTAAGTYSYTVTCQPISPATGSPTANGQVLITAQPVAPIVTLKANGQSSVTIPYGAKATLTWTTNTGGPVTGTCVKGPAGSAWTSNTSNNSDPLDPPTYTGSLNNPGGTITYTLKCFGPGAPVAGVTAQATVTWAQVVGPLNPSVNIWADPNPVPSGNNTTIHWEAFNASSCTKTNGSGTNWTTGNATSGTLTVGAPTTLGEVTYDISCVGNPGTSPAIGSVTVPVAIAVPPPIVTLKANGQSSVTIPYGAKATLTWTTNTGGPVTGTCVKGPAGSAWTSNTSNNSNPQVPTYTGTSNSNLTVTYTISCTGPGSATPVTASATVKWAPPIGIKLTATPLTPPLVVGGKVKFNWTTNGATSCNKTFVLAGGVSPLPTNAGLANSFTTGALPLGIHTFTLSCVNSFTGITANASASVKVNSIGSTPPAPTVSLDATLYVVPLNQISTLTWASTDATSCTRTGGASTNWTTVTAGALDAKSGSWNVPTNVAGTKVYSIQCFGTGGASQIVSKQIIVQPYQNPPTANVTANYVANSLSAPKGSSVKIRWNTTYCTSLTKSSSPVVPGWEFAAGDFNSPTNGAVGSSITYTVTCNNGWPGAVPSTATSSVTVTLTAPPIPSPTVDVSASHLSLPWGPLSDPDYSTTVSWNITKATSCTKTGNWSGNLTLDSNGSSSGSTSFYNVWTDRTYGINCNGFNGANPYTASDSVTIDVN